MTSGLFFSELTNFFDDLHVACYFRKLVSFAFVFAGLCFPVCMFSTFYGFLLFDFTVKHNQGLFLCKYAYFGRFLFRSIFL